MLKDKLPIFVIYFIIFLFMLFVSFLVFSYYPNQSLLRTQKIHYVGINGIPVEIEWKWSGREMRKQGLHLAEIVYRITISATNETQKRIFSEVDLETTAIYFKDKDGFNVVSEIAEFQRAGEDKIISTGNVWIDKKMISKIVDIKSTKY